MSSTKTKGVPEVVTSKEAAEILGRTGKTLMRWRKEGYGPKPVEKLGVYWLYDKRDVLEWATKLRPLKKRVQ